MKSTPPRHFADETAESLNLKLSRTDVSRIAAVHSNSMLRQAVADAGIERSVSSGELAAMRLASLIGATTRLMIEQANGYSAARWLWYLRRVPEALFEGDYRTTLGYDTSLAESIAAQSSKATEAPAPGEFLRFKIDDATCRHLVRFIAGTKVLAALQQLYRRVGRGAELYFHGFEPSATESDAVTRSIEIYDERMETGLAPSLAGFGLDGRDLMAAPICYSASSPTTALILFHRIRPLWREPPRVSTSATVANVCIRHSPNSVAIESFLAPFLDIDASMLGFLETVEPLLTLLMMLPPLWAEKPTILTDCVQFGYFIIPPGCLRRAFDQWITRVGRNLRTLVPSLLWSSSYETWRTRLARLAPNSWPPNSGGAIYELQNAMMVDVTGITGTLRSHAIVERSSGRLMQTRGDTFELQVQESINASPWRSSDSLHALRGRTLRYDSVAFTDLDAVGERNGTLLLVSCKSVVYDAAYDRGEFRIVRNIQDRIDKAVSNWVAVVERLDKRRTGDNFDLSRYHRIIGVVCTPFVVYSVKPLTLSFAADGLRRCVAVYELARWVAGNGSP